MKKSKRGKQTRKEVWKEVLQGAKERFPGKAKETVSELVSQPVPIRAIRLLGRLIGMVRPLEQASPSGGSKGPSAEGKGNGKEPLPGKVGKLQTEYGKLLDTYQSLFGFVADLIERVKAQEFSLEQLVDLGYLLRESENLADELRKELKARKNLVGMIICKQASDKAVSSGSMDMTVRGTLAMGLPEVKQAPKLPKRGTKEYHLLCEHFGIPKETAETEVIDFHFKRLGNYLVTLAGEGKNVPQGVQDTYPVFETIFRKYR